MISRNDFTHIKNSQDSKTEAIRFLTQFVMPKQEKPSLMFSRLLHSESISQLVPPQEKNDKNQPEPHLQT